MASWNFSVTDQCKVVVLNFWNYYDLTMYKNNFNKQLRKTALNNILRKKAYLLTSALRNTFLLTHSSICDLLLPWVCLHTYLHQRQNQANQNINRPWDWCRIGPKFGTKRAIHQFNQSFMSTAKINVSSANFSHVLYRPEWVLLWLDRIYHELDFSGFVYEL